MTVLTSLCIFLGQSHSYRMFCLVQRQLWRSWEGAARDPCRCPPGVKWLHLFVFGIKGIILLFEGLQNSKLLGQHAVNIYGVHFAEKISLRSSGTIDWAVALLADFKLPPLSVSMIQYPETCCWQCLTVLCGAVITTRGQTHLDGRHHPKTQHNHNRCTLIWLAVCSLTRQNINKVVVVPLPTRRTFPMDLKIDLLPWHCNTNCTLLFVSLFAWNWF